MKVYIAAPYTQGDPVMNIRAVIEVADTLAHAGAFPFIPHLSHLWHLISPHAYEFWMAQDSEWLEACDAVYRIPGPSEGADYEVALAEMLDMPVYVGIDGMERLLLGLREMEAKA